MVAENVHNEKTLYDYLPAAIKNMANKPSNLTDE